MTHDNCGSIKLRLIHHQCGCSFIYHIQYIHLYSLSYFTLVHSAFHVHCSWLLYKLHELPFSQSLMIVAAG